MSEQEHPLLVLVSAPSGAGKTTLCDMLLLDWENMVYSVSCTTRTPRGAEQDGVDYHFMDRERFLEHVDRGDFLEHAEVHGAYYGTLRRTVLDALEAGRDVLMDIDVQGAAQIRAAVRQTELLRRAFVDVFISPPSLSALEERLRRRREDSDAAIERRLKNASREIEASSVYERVIVNDVLPTAYNELSSFLRERKRRLGEAP